MNANTHQSRPADGLFEKLSAISRNGHKIHKVCTEWEHMSNDARYGKLVNMGMAPMLADRYANGELVLLPTETFEKIIDTSK